jgi:glycosyltransferase involved in cell wall biosynthesis
VKIAVYTIAKNEERFVKRWFNSAKEADSLHILDTGSTDGTVTIARDLGIDVRRLSINPWRFDTARNIALTMVPEDVDLCVALDMDEVLVEGWREHLENCAATRPRYTYTWSWKEDGTPGLQYAGDKIHARHGFYWKHPVHEVITPQDEETQEWTGLQIHHFPDNTKSRGQYFPLLELAVQEDPEDDRNSHYLAREYFFHNRLEEAAAEFIRHLSLPRAQWLPERAQSMRYLAKCQPWMQETWLLRAAAETPDRREPWVDLAKMYRDREDWVSCYSAASRALAITQKPLEYLCDEEAWGSLPRELIELSVCNIMLPSTKEGR